MVFPLIKLAFLAMKQMSKPLARRLKENARRSPVFRDYICKPPAQLYHWYDVRMKMSSVGLTKPQKVAPLNEEMAVELGSELLGEMVIFSMGALIILLEYKRSAWKDERKEMEQNSRLLFAEQKIDNLARALEYQHNKMNELNSAVGKKRAAPPKELVEHLAGVKEAAEEDATRSTFMQRALEAIGLSPR